MTRQKSYSDLLKSIPVPEKTPEFNIGGKLIICLIEYRIMEEIEYVINAALRVYNPQEIGLAIVHGTHNESYVNEKFGNWKNIKLINTKHQNLDRGGYSALLKQPQFYENFTNWSHMLVYQTDALLVRRIDDVYFDFDYIGAPWTTKNQWTKYNAGNGGFSLRNVKSCVKACEPQRGKAHGQIHRGNEDGYFCDQDIFKYPPINSDLHKNFAMEKVKYKNPIGVHQIYHNWNLTNQEYDEFIGYCKSSLCEKKIYHNNTVIKEYIQSKFKANSPRKGDDSHKTGLVAGKLELSNPNIKIKTEDVPHKLNTKQEIGPFTLVYDNEKRNRWHINSSVNYEILLCYKDDPNTVAKTYTIDKAHEACIHKKAPGVKFMSRDNYIYLIFYPGFPNGGEAWADIHAPSGRHFQHCTHLPRNGAIILKCRNDNIFNIPTSPSSAVSKEVRVEEQVKIKVEDRFRHINHKILVFDLYCGVGYYNQLFSFEIAVYLASISKRYLIINIRHPLVACGKPNKEYGNLIEYVTDKFKEDLVGFECKTYNDCYALENEINIPAKISNCAIVDNELDTKENAADIKEFCHWRQKVSSDVFKPLYSDTKVISFNKSNASRVLYNFYTTQDNYTIMNRICKNLSEYNPLITDTFNDVWKRVQDKEFISVHLRFGDWHKGLPAITQLNETIQNNLTGWLNENNGGELPLFIMTDRKDNPFFNELKKKWKIYFTDEFMNEDDKNKLKTKYKNTTVAEFLVQKQLCEMGQLFIGSQGSTVSVHAQYMNHLNNKPHEYYSFVKSTAFNSNTLTMNLVNPDKKWGWNRQNYMGGHPVSWTLYFEDNVLN
tara:strand:+ start:1229 stop:3712 length:2484 start_codon:yes stop_codon:yes gene_type:complete